MSRESHPHLLAQQLKSALSQAKLNLREIILQQNIDYYKLDQNSLRVILQKVKQEVCNQPEYQQFKEQSHERMREQIDSLYTSDSRKHSYLVDVFREATAYPLVKDREEPVFNFSPLYRQHISKELRRVLWGRQFNTDALRKKYLLVDRQVMPYMLEEELKLSLDKLATINDLQLRENQKDAALRIMQYFVKVSGKVPHRYHNYMALNVVDLFSFHSPTKITDLGAITLGLVKIAEAYKEADVDLRFERIMKALVIVDGDSAAHIKDCYIQGGHGKRQLNECFEYFRLTLGASHLPLRASQFMIDQLVIRKFCNFDIYVMFAIMVLIVSDEFDPQEKHKPSLKEILNRAKTIIKVEDFIEAYTTIYQNIPVFHSVDDLQSQPKNELLLEMIACDGSKTKEHNSDFVIRLEERPHIGNKI